MQVCVIIIALPDATDKYSTHASVAGQMTRSLFHFFVYCIFWFFYRIYNSRSYKFLETILDKLSVDHCRYSKRQLELSFQLHYHSIAVIDLDADPLICTWVLQVWLQKQALRLCKTNRRLSLMYIFSLSITSLFNKNVTPKKMLSRLYLLWLTQY